MMNNPSHLEAVNPVVEGFARARQEMAEDGDRQPVLPLLIHGDAAFAGQGVVAETLNLSQLAGYRTGGTIHIVINNQIGYTTLPEHARSTRYSTDIAKMLMVPVFHVHGEDPEAVVHVAAGRRLPHGPSARTWSSTWSASAATAITRATSPISPNPSCTSGSASGPPLDEIYAGELIEGAGGHGGQSRWPRLVEDRLDKDYQADPRQRPASFP
jgi:hypothetical protein